MQLHQHYEYPAATFSEHFPGPAMQLSRSDPHCTPFTNRDDTPLFHGTSPPTDTAESAPHHGETGPVWEEAAFIPPLRYRSIVELLHRLAMGEETAVVLLALSLAQSPCDDARCRVTDPALLRLAARQSGISVAGRTDEAIACDVAAAVVSEYAAPHHYPPCRRGHA